MKFSLIKDFKSPIDKSSDLEDSKIYNQQHEIP